MEPTIALYLDRFEEKLRKHLLRLATQREALDGKLLESQDLTDYWLTIEAEYMADAVSEIASYPTVSVAWALYIGLAAAYCWDTDWDTYRNTPYTDYYGSQGFDNMDDHIVQDILGLTPQSDEARQLVSLIQTLAQETVSLIRHEQIEPQSPMAFYAFSRACRVMFALGVALQMKRLGYYYENIN